MKTRYFLTFIGCVLAAVLSAQSNVPQAVKSAKAPYKPLVAPLEMPVPPAENAYHLSHLGASDRSNPEEPVGTTFWDAQSYGCISQRIYARPNGEPAAAWIYSNSAAHTLRGTGYNVRAGGNWSVVNSIVETQAGRTGFPSAVILGDDSEVIISHNTAANPFKLWMSKKAPGASTWTETALPAPPGIRMLWPKVAVGGPDNQTIHVIGITAPTGTATLGVVYKGMNGHLLYYRSTDGGATWDKQNVVIPGIDSTRYTGISADTYTIDAQGNNVAIGVFPPQSWEDLRLWKSSDNGETWSDIAVRDFPDAIENYDPMPGVSYTFEDIGEVDPLRPDSLAVLSNDGNGNILIDASGQAHVWFGRMYVMDDNFTDSSYFVYPSMDGLMYWKESFGPDSLQIITRTLDYDGDGYFGTVNLKLEEIAPYGATNISSFPSAGIDANGTIYVVYSACIELWRTNTGDVNDEFYRHLYLIKSSDNGETWGPPLDISAPPYVDEVSTEFVECVYPSVPRHIGDKVWVLYQQDFTPGSAVWGAHHDVIENSMMWIEVDPADIPVSAFEPPKADASFDLVLAPNPVASAAQLSATFEGGNPVLVEIFDLTGRLVQQQRLSQNGAGRQTLTLPVQNLQAGTYTVRVSEGERFGVAKLLKI